MKYINEIRDGERIREIYLCKDKQILKTKAGKSYYSLKLQDKTGIIDAKVWDINSAIGNFEIMDYIQIDAEVILFQNAPQLNVKRIRKCQENEYNINDFMPVTNKNIDDMYIELIEYTKYVKEIHLKQLIDSFFIEDKEFIKNFKNHSAAKTIHHGFIGGLLEHTLGVVKICNFFADYYSIINKDLIITAALFHDMGKLYEISSFPENDYTDDGQLLGHIYIGAEKLSERIKTIEGFPKKLASELIHCILAHHGELEYGSPKKPAIPEAFALSFADNADAKLETLTEIFKANDNKNEWFMNKFFDTKIKKSSMVK